MKTTAAFRALTANRKANRIEAANQGGYMVRKVRKDGSLGAVSKDYTGQSEFTAEAAAEYQQRLQQLNPGSLWQVVPA